MNFPPSLELSQLSLLLENDLQLFATGSNDIQNAALLATQSLFNHSLRSERSSKEHIDQLVSSLDPLDAPKTRSKTNGKRKRSPSPCPNPKIQFLPTPLRELFVDGMNEDQLWAQIDLRTKNIRDILNLVLEEDGPLESDEGEEVDDESESEEEEMELQDLLAAYDGDDVEWSDEDNASDEDVENEEEFGLGDGDQIETIAELRDPSSDEESEPVSLRTKLKPKHGRQPQLDDDFFDLAAFNAEIEAAEARSSGRGRLGGSDQEEESDDDVIDMFAPIGEDQSLEGGLGEEPHELYYNDFFVPPKRQRIPRISISPEKAGKVRFHEEVRVKKIEAKGKNRPLSTLYDDDDDELEEAKEDSDEAEEESRYIDDSHSIGSETGGEDESDASVMDAAEGAGRETIDRFKDDLFAEEEDDDEDMTSHEKRMATLSKQIVELETENIGPKDWALMGEAGSKSRPQNSLLEEDLEFERVIKPVPVVTQETVRSLEDRIKARILEGQFDDVVRLRPHDDKPFLPSRFLELKDTKSAQSLAQIYEEEYMAAQTNGTPGDDRDGKLQKEHQEIEKLWESICYKLDALCNAHYIPKQPRAIISTVSNVPVATLESALPTTKSAKTVLAPEELFVPTGSDLRARSELTPSEKQSLHNKKKKAKRKARDLLQNHTDKYAKMKDPRKQKQAALETVVKSGKGVTVVGKKNKELLTRKSKKLGNTKI
ncbi:U3 small nucleolar ribonucleoprotein complex, subunit Mpp10 [Amanita rubescens]|nr:U3 small nucleolar ribonucleoprotein complex, subunit Mpp10 [Amanita rubescens]